MNLIKEYLGTIAGVQVFAIISMLIFLVTFIFMIIHAYSIKKDDIREYGRLPLEDDEPGQDED